MEHSRTDREQSGVNRAFGALKWIPPLLARILVGVTFIFAGWGHIHNVTQFAGQLTSIGVPASTIFSPLIGYSELVAGLFVLFGLLTRVASLPLLAIMFVALAMAKGTMFASLMALFGASEIAHIVLLTYLVFYGGGAVSVDQAVRSYWTRPRGEPPARWQREPLPQRQ